MEVLESNVRRGSQVYEDGHVRYQKGGGLLVYIMACVRALGCVNEGIAFG